MDNDKDLISCNSCEGSGFIKNNSTKKMPVKIITNKTILEKIAPFKTCDDCLGTGKENYTKVLDKSCCVNFK